MISQTPISQLSGISYFDPFRYSGNADDEQTQWRLLFFSFELFDSLDHPMFLKATTRLVKMTVEVSQEFVLS